MTYKLVALKNGTVNLVEGREVVESYDDREEAQKALDEMKAVEFMMGRFDNFVMKLRVELEIELGRKYTTEELTVILKDSI